MKILYLGGFELPDKNAAAHRVMANAKLLREMGFDVSFIGISKDLKNAPHEVDAFVSNPISYPTSIKKWLKQIISFVDEGVIIKEHPDYVVLYNFPSIASLSIIHMCHNMGIKVICDLTEWEQIKGYSPRTLIKKCDIWLRMHYCIAKMDGVIAISKFLYNYYKGKTNCIYMPPTVDLQDPKWNRTRTLVSHDKVQLIYAGTGKGAGNKDRLDFVIESIRGKTNMELTVIGMTEEQYQQDYGKVLPNDAIIHFKGRVPHHEAIRAVQNSDFQMLIRPSNLKNNAGFPTKLVESVTCCTPLIATVTSNICDYIQDGVHGFIVSDQCSLEDVIKRIDKLPKEKIIEMKDSCRKIYSFDYRTYKEELSKLFN